MVQAYHAVPLSVEYEDVDRPSTKGAHCLEVERRMSG